MPRFRKIPVEIEAWHNTLEEGNDPPSWVYDAIVILDDGALIIRTLEGDMKVSLNDWIIRGVAGEVYPCKPAIFAATYEPVRDEPFEPSTIDYEAHRE